ncbi:MAG: hypothetical protein WBA92_06185 [Pseudorhodobacter sp.]
MVDLGLAEDDLKEAVQDTYRGTFKNVHVPGIKGTGAYAFETHVSFVEPGKSDYIVELAVPNTFVQIGQGKRRQTQLMSATSTSLLPRRLTTIQLVAMPLEMA